MDQFQKRVLLFEGMSHSNEGQMKNATPWKYFNITIHVTSKITCIHSVSDAVSKNIQQKNRRSILCTCSKFRKPTKIINYFATLPSICNNCYGYVFFWGDDGGRIRGSYSQYLSQNIIHCFTRLFITSAQYP